MAATTAHESSELALSENSSAICIDIRTLAMADDPFAVVLAALNDGYGTVTLVSLRPDPLTEEGARCALLSALGARSRYRLPGPQACRELAKRVNDLADRVWRERQGRTPAEAQRLAVLKSDKCLSTAEKLLRSLARDECDLRKWYKDNRKAALDGRLAWPEETAARIVRAKIQAILPLRNELFRFIATRRPDASPSKTTSWHDDLVILANAFTGALVSENPGATFGTKGPLPRFLVWAIGYIYQIDKTVTAVDKALRDARSGTKRKRRNVPGQNMDSTLS